MCIDVTSGAGQTSCMPCGASVGFEERLLLLKPCLAWEACHALPGMRLAIQSPRCNRREQGSAIDVPYDALELDPPSATLSA